MGRLQKEKRVTKKIKNDVRNKGINIDEENNNLIPVNKVKSNKNMFNTIEVIVIMIITAVFGILIGGVVTYFKYHGTTSVYNKNIKELINTYNDVVDNYYGEVDNEKLLEAGIKGMIDYLGDPYSSYLDPNYSVEFNEELEGEYVGLGAEISRNLNTNILTVTRVLDKSPAEKSGLKVGDIITKIDNKDITSIETEEIVAMIKEGEKGTVIKLNIKRNEEEIVIEFERGIVELTSVVGQLIEENDKKIGLITVKLFAKNSYEQFKKEIDKLQEQGMEYLIIDVRNNNGGYITSVQSIVGMFLEKNEIMFIIKDNNNEEKLKNTKNKVIDIPVAVLINGGSASASEILAAALNENLGIDLVGTSTYGKGSVQKAKTLSSGAIIKYTIQEWLTPQGKSIEGVGIKPTIEVEMNKLYYEEATFENDSQLQKAIEVVLEK